MQHTDLHRRRVLLVQQIVNRHDPIGLIEIGCPIDEYEPELSDMLDAIRDAESVESLSKRICEIFETWFSPEIAKPFDGWAELAEELWITVRPLFNRPSDQ